MGLRGRRVVSADGDHQLITGLDVVALASRPILHGLVRPRIGDLGLQRHLRLSHLGGLDRYNRLMLAQQVQLFEAGVEIDDHQHQYQDGGENDDPARIDRPTIHVGILPGVEKVGKNGQLWYNTAPSNIAERCTLRLRNTPTKGLEDPMKVLLVKDVYKLGRAGDVKKVADGYGRNFLLTHGLAVLATPGAMKTAVKIRSEGEVRRAAMNSELKDLADHVNGVTLTFAAKAGETGKLYGSITTQDVAKAIQEQTRYEVKRQQIDMQPIREVGEYKAHVRLTIDLVPEIKIIVHREGESAEAAAEESTEKEEKPRKSRARKKAEAPETEKPAAEDAEPAESAE